MSDIAKLTVALYANSAQFVSELQKSQRKSNEWKREVSAAYNTVKTAGAVAAAATVASLTLIYKQQSKLIDQTAKFADRIGISTESLSQFRYAAELTGVGQKSLDNSLQAMVRRLAEAEQGTGEAAKSLRQLGLDAEELGRLTPDEQLYVLADAFKGVESQSERVRIAFNLFGREGVSMVNMLAGGADGLRTMTTEADELGLSLSRVDAAKVEMANDAFFKVTQTSTAFKQHLTTELAPIVAALSDEFVRMAKEHGGMSQYISDGLHSLFVGVGYVGNAYRGWEIIFKGIEASWAGLKVVMQQGLLDLAGDSEGVGDAILKSISPVHRLHDALSFLGEYNPYVDELAKGLDSLSAINPVNKDVISESTAEFNKAINELRELTNQPLPTEAVDEWYENVKSKYQSLAEEYASSVNRNSASAGALTPEGKPAKEGPTEQEKALERHRLEMDRIRQEFLEKDQLEYEQWQGRQSKLADWFLAEYEASKSNKAQMAALEDQYLTLSQNNHKKYQDNINKIESARMQTRYKAASSMFGSMADLAKTFGGEQTGAYKALFAVSKAFSIAESIMAIQTGVAKAAALGWPAGIPAMASVLSATSGIISTIQGTGMPTYHTGGMAGYGSDNFSDSLKRNEVPAILERDEEILPTYDPRHRSNLKKGRGAGGGGFQWTGNIIINNNGEPVRAEASMDDEGNLQMWLERADEFIAQGFIEGTGQTSQANDAVNGSGRANTAIR